MPATTRTILAILLVMIILLLWQNYASKRDLPKPEKAETEEQKVEEDTVPKVAEVDVLTESQQEEEVVVETELFRAVLSSIGGTITSFQLKEYDGVGGGWIERVADLEQWTEKEIRASGENTTDEWVRRKEALQAIGKWMKKSYAAPPPVEIDRWVGKAEELVVELKEAYSGLGSECDRLLQKIEPFPDWLKTDHTGWVELIPEGRRTLRVHLAGVNLDTMSCEIGRETIAGGEAISFRYKLEDEKELVKQYIFRRREYRFELRVLGDQETEAISWNSGLAITEGDKDDDVSNFMSLAFMGGGVLKENLKGLKTPVSQSGAVDWVGTRTKYFFAGIFPESASATKGFEAHLVSDASVGGGTASLAGFGCMGPRGTKHKGSTQISVRLNCPGGRDFFIYVGPVDYDELKRLGVNAEHIVYFGWSVIAPLSKLLFSFLKFLRRFIPNYGLVIILFSLIMKLVFYPLTHRGTKSMREMAKLQPKLKQLQKQYGSDYRKLRSEMAKIGYSPEKQLAGCVPLLVQMPVFIALYSVLRTTIELRRASFISFWIRDLSVHDPYYVLPLLMGGFMVLQSLVTPTDPRQRWTTLFMPVVVTVIFLNFPAGLVLYWLVNNILSVAEHFIVARREEVSTA